MYLLNYADAVGLLHTTASHFLLPTILANEVLIETNIQFCFFYDFCVFSNAIVGTKHL